MDPTREPHGHLPHLSAFQSQPLIFFTVTTEHRRELLANEATHGILREVWERSAQANGRFVGDYVVMPDHVHFFARSAVTADTMSAWTKLWKSVSSRRLAREKGVTGSIWQAEYFDRFPRSGESYREKWEYVRENPVRAGLIERADEWPYWGRIHELRA